MKNVVDLMPSKPEECLYCYRSVFGKALCKHTKKPCGLRLDETNREFECDNLIPLDDTLKDALKAYTKILDKKIK